jgi:hypothetical protein
VILILVGNQFLTMKTTGAIIDEVSAWKADEKHRHYFYKPHVVRTSPNVKYLLINDQQTKKEYIFRLQDNCRLILEKEIDKMDAEDIVFRAATQLDNDGNIWQVTYNPDAQEKKKFKILVNQDTNIMSGEAFP